MKIVSKTLLQTAALLWITTGLAAADVAQISDARIVQPPPGAKVAAAYFTINNPTDQPLIITGASSNSIPKVSIHLSAVVDDVAKMMEQESVTVAAGQSLEFKHGSYHLMLMGLTSPLAPGTSITFEVQTSVGPLPLEIPIITPDEATSMNDGKMDHGKMGSDDMKHESMEHDTMKKPMDTDQKTTESN